MMNEKCFHPSLLRIRNVCSEVVKKFPLKGNLILYNLDKSWGKRTDEDTNVMVKLNTYNRKQYIKNICFLDCSRLSYSSTDGIIHVLEFDEFGKLKRRKTMVSCS